MPKTSERQQLLRKLVELIAIAVLDAEDAEDDQMMLGPDYAMNVGEDDEDWAASDLSELMDLLTMIESTRYLGPRRRYLKSRDFRTNFFFQLPDDEFRQLVRVSKSSFRAIERMIENHAVFHNNSHNKQAPVWFQLAIALDCFGNYGNGVSLGRTFKLWGVGKGTCVLYTDRVLLALNDIAPKKITWPDRRQRAKMSRRMAREGFPGCVGFIDGTTIPLSQKPAIDGECYFDRKHRYSVNAQIICDDRRRIISVFSGWPGSCSDSSVYQRMQLAQDDQKRRFFSRGQYLIADSAYPADRTHNTIVPAYRKKMRGKDNVAFNTCLAHVRVVNEHTIGVLKGRFSCLKELRIQIKKKEDMNRLLKWLVACCVLHNVLIDLKDLWLDDDEADSEIENEGDVSDVEDADGDDVQDDEEENFVFRQRLKIRAVRMQRRPGKISWYREK